MSKRNVTYIKPQEPSFLRKLKAEAGYKAPDTVETKVGTFISAYDFRLVRYALRSLSTELKENRA
jgi:hypothetical protein